MRKFLKKRDAKINPMCAQAGPRHSTLPGKKSSFQMEQYYVGAKISNHEGHQHI